MNFKRNCFLISALVSCLFTVAACSSSNVFKQYKYMDAPTESEEVIHKNKDGEIDYRKYCEYKSYKAKTDDPYKEKDLGSTYEALYKSGSRIMKAEGEQNILVVPVKFEGYNIRVDDSKYIQDVKKAFFGEASNNRFVSVAEYYNRASYGKLQIKGEVCNKFFTFQEPFSKVKDFKQKDVKDSYNKVVNSWYKETFNKDIDDKFKIDPENPLSKNYVIYFVYAYPVEDKDKANPEFFWAYTFSDIPCSWSSYTTMNPLTNNPDAHTFIHEVGHLFGLQDYYPKGDAGSAPDPAGKIDMMDCSVGDQTAYSKMQLDWVRPYHVVKDCEITIKPLIRNGDLILIKNDWNQTVFDEYYLIELYVPLGLNYFDSNIGNSEAKLPTLPGIKIYHVDARLAYFEQGLSNKFVEYCDKGADPYGKVIKFAHDNSTYSSAAEEIVPEYKANNFYELQLNNVGHPVAGCATDANLFHKGDSFAIRKSLFHDPSETSFNVTVKNLSYSSATLQITKPN